MTNTRAARQGRERSCNQCGGSYRSPRSTSLYCSPACRMKAHRGTAPTGGRKSGPSSFTVIGKALVFAGFAGPIGPVSRRDTAPVIYGLTVPNAHALAELRSLFNARGWGHLGEDEFELALTVDGIRAYSTASPEAEDRKRWQARQSAAIRRSRQASLA